MPLLDFHTHRPTAEGVITPRCFGIHPWVLAARAISTSRTSVNDSGMLAAQDGLWEGFMLAAEGAQMIGECGLDKCCDTPWERQMEVFVRQIEIAEQLGKPLVIHCVKAFNELMELRKTHKQTPWVVHGFTGSTELYNQLLKADIEVSFGAAILDKRREKVRETLSKADPDRIFLETDDSGADIREIYHAAAEILGIDNLEERIMRHYLEVVKM
ncbi:MAG: TatD family hydrolase [Bacteroidales bacterium]|nr:TatD family hydrolase [Bacteroidales bacterium]